MKNTVLKIVTATSIVATVFLSPPAHANCKVEADAANNAQNERNKECAIAAKPISKKTAKQIKQGDAVCKKKDDEYKKAKKKLTACLK